MSTHSLIGILNDDGTVDYVDCNWNGQPYANGAVLLAGYRDPAKVRQLMELRSLSSLGRDIGDPVDYHRAYHDPALLEKQCLSFWRDRQDRRAQAKQAPSVAAYADTGLRYVARHLYLYAAGGWQYGLANYAALQPTRVAFAPLTIAQATHPNVRPLVQDFLRWRQETDGRIDPTSVAEYVIRNAAPPLTPAGLHYALTRWCDALAGCPVYGGQSAGVLLELLAATDSATATAPAVQPVPAAA